MDEFKNFPGAKKFENLALPHLRGAVERFFGGSVKYDAQPIAYLKHHFQIDITENPRRGVYVGANQEYAIILGRVFVAHEVKAVFSLQLVDTPCSGIHRILNIFEAALARTLSHTALNKFQEKPHQFGDELIEFAISNFFSKGYYDTRNILHLIGLFHSLSTARFEGRNFTTGLVITRSRYAFAQKGRHTREGKLLRLNRAKQLSAGDGLDKRFWYLADGQTSFFLSNPSLEISDLFLADSGRQGLVSFVDDYTLSRTVKGGDALFRVISQAEFSITGWSGYDFNFKEGRWRLRNLFQIADVIRSALNVQDDFVQGFLFYVFYLSRRRLSSILWIPPSLESIDSLLISRNELTTDPLSLLDDRHSQTLIRLLSSDGVSIFDTTGSLLYFGSMVDISNLHVTGVKGTGESVASLLGKSGLCVKVSQDGTIKLFANSLSTPLIF